MIVFERAAFFSAWIVECHWTGKSDLFAGSRSAVLFQARYSVPDCSSIYDWRHYEPNALATDPWHYCNLNCFSTLMEFAPEMRASYSSNADHFYAKSLIEEKGSNLGPRT